MNLVPVHEPSKHPVNFLCEHVCETESCKLLAHVLKGTRQQGGQAGTDANHTFHGGSLLTRPCRSNGAGDDS